MPRYHFNIHDGHDEIDTEGTELPNLIFARREAIRVSGAILEQEGHRLSLGADWRMEVTDDVGLVLFRLDFTVMESPAAAMISGVYGAGRKRMQQS